MSAGAARTGSSAISSMRVASGVATKIGCLWCMPMSAMAIACQSGMCFSAAICVALPRATWRRASATRGAVFITSSPSTSAASADSMPRSVAAGTGPVRSTSATRLTSRPSAAEWPSKYFVLPTSWRRAKFDSRLARGEPMPTTPFAVFSRLAAFSSASSAPIATNAPSRLTIGWRGRSLLLTKPYPKRPRSHRKWWLTVPL